MTWFYFEMMSLCFQLSCRSEVYCWPEVNKWHYSTFQMTSEVFVCYSPHTMTFENSRALVSSARDTLCSLMMSSKGSPISFIFSHCIISCTSWWDFPVWPQNIGITGFNLLLMFVTILSVWFYDIWHCFFITSITQMLLFSQWNHISTSK